MKARELRTLRGQLLLTAGMFAGCVVISAVVVFARPWFESFLLEKFKVPLDKYPESVRQLTTAAAEGKIDKDKFYRLLPDDRELLYEAWLRSEQPSPRTPRALAAVDATFYSVRAEKTVVCGDGPQRARALEFLVKMQSPETKAVLERLLEWADRRNLPELREQIRAVLEQVSRGDSTNASSKSLSQFVPS